MIVPTIFATLVCLATWTKSVAATLSITADHYSFGGVNFPQLQFFTPQHRDDTIREIVKSGARVIRLFIRPDENHPDVERTLGEFDKSLLDQLDDTLAAIHHLSKGQIKVIIVPHDAHALRGSNGVPCDAYCKKLDGAFLDFYSSDEFRSLYKTRLEVFFKHYPSKNFDGRSWNELSEIILGVDLQNQPFSGIWPIPSGESWLCDIANHLKFTVGLDNANIAVISGGICGAQKVGGIQNFPDSAFDCKAIDVIGIHGYFSKEHDATAGTPWANLFIPGNTLTARAKDKEGKGKLLLVEEWEYVHNDDFGLFYKKEAIFDQGNALNWRGIPWLYSHISTLNEGKTARVHPLRPEYTAWTALKGVLKRSFTARSNFNWSKYLPPPVTIVAPTADEAAEQHLRSILIGAGAEWKLRRRNLSQLTTVPLNPYILEQSDCTFGCEGHLCDAADGCAPDLICKNSVCQRNEESQPGQIGDRCNSKAVCQSHLRCVKGECQACEARRTRQPEEKRKRTIAHEVPLEAPERMRKAVQPNDPNGSCYTDALPALFVLQEQSIASASPMLPVCLPPAHHPNPCHSAIHCSADQYCFWGSCVTCTASDSCLGAPCRSNNKCKTGYCNDHGRCDYAGQKKKPFGPGGARGQRNTRIAGVPKGHERGPAKVRDEAMRINIPEEKVAQTGMPVATG
ncbi:hypothetical protein BDW02DRAFT_124112 [Decorospora gaudefroyi]|uniref:Glycoside hydrolase n=1 Tax=Decorospora gaudefroyi TaxID=184978 RepID=A0A6A5K699_9PLEO|nr:hypothetical protein BDW02DRAFT_124112 [Decorospora gaudefroyi]